MKRLTKITISSLLALLMIIMQLPMNAFAANESDLPVAYVSELEETINTPVYDLLTGIPGYFIGSYGTIDLQTAYAFKAYDEAGMRAIELNNGELPEDMLDELFASPYQNWNADFVVSFDKAIKKESLGLSGYYGYAETWGVDGWLGYLLPKALNAGEEFRLLDHVGLSNTSGITYAELCALVHEFDCGAFNVSEANIGTTMTVTLRIFERDSNGDETGNWLDIDSYEYTFDRIDGILSKGLTYYYVGEADSAEGLYNIGERQFDGDSTTSKTLFRLGDEPVKRTVKLTSTAKGTTTTVAKVSGGGVFEEDTAVTVTAYPANGYKFIGWFDKADTAYAAPLSRNQIYSFELAEDTDLVAVYEPTDLPGFKLTVNGSKFNLNGRAQTNRIDRTFNVGQVMVLEHNDPAKVFKYWVNSSKNIVCTQSKYVFVLVNNTELRAVYSNQNTESAEGLVVFKNAYLQLISSFMYEEGETVEFPSVAPSKLGGIFDNWYLADEDGNPTNVVASNASIKAALADKDLIVVVPGYTSTNQSLPVTVSYTDGTNSIKDSESKTAYVGEAASFTAPATIGGKVFQYWKMNGTTVSYARDYTLVSATQNPVILEAVYGASSIEKLPTVAITQVSTKQNADYYTISDTLQYFIPEDLEVVEVGVVYGTKKEVFGTSTGASKLAIGGEDTYTHVTGLTSNGGIYTFNASMKDPKATLYAKAYVIYKDDLGNVNTIYSDMKSGSYETLSVFNITYTGVEGAVNPNPDTYTQGSAVTLAPLSRVGYTFDGWFLNGTKVTEISTSVQGDITLEARWTLLTYTISWDTDGDGIADDTTTVNYGVVPSHADGVKEGNAQYSYTFVGWNTTPVAATADATYTAQFTQSVNKYTVTWKNGDVVLAEDEVEYGVTPSYEGETPVKEETELYTYTFTGWAPEVSAVTGAVTYAAQFDETIKASIVTVLPYTDQFTYRIGNENAVAVSKLFKGENAVINDVEIEPIDSVTGVYDSDAKTLKFEGTGLVKVTAKGYAGSVPGDAVVESEVLYLEIVDALNVTGIASAQTGNVVLLNDCSMSYNTIKIENGHTFYGNGFKISSSYNGNRLGTNGMTEGYINIASGGVLDNVRFFAPVYPNAFLYATEVKTPSNLDPDSSDATHDRYMYQWSGVAVTGGGTIANSYIYGARNNIFVAGDATIINTVTENGSLSNIQVRGSSDTSVTLKDVTTIQNITNATTGDTSKKMLGMGIALGGSDVTSNEKIVLEGTLDQYNWISEDDAAVVSNQYVKAAINGAVKEGNYQIVKDGKTLVNTGIAILNTKTADITDNRTDKAANPYLLSTVTMIGSTGQVYSITKNATAPKFDAPEYVPNAYLPVKPVLTVTNLPTAAPEDETSYAWNDKGTVKVSFPKGSSYTLDAKAIADINVPDGATLSVSCNSASATGDTVKFTQAGSNKLVYTLSNIPTYGANGTLIGTSSYDYTVNVMVTTVQLARQDAKIIVDTEPNITGVKINSSGDRYFWFDIFDGLTLIDYDEAGNEVVVLDSTNKTQFVKSIVSVSPTGDLVNGNYSASATVTLTLADGRVLKMTMVRTDSSNSPGGTKSVYIRTNSTSNPTSLYYVTNSAAGSSGVNTNMSNQTFRCAYKISGYKFIGFSGKEVSSSDSHIVATGLYNGTYTTPATASRPTTTFNGTTTLMYNLMGGEMEGNNYTQTSPATLPAATKEGYAFKGWNDAADGSGTTYKAGDKLPFSATKTLYAMWGTPCTITYDANGGECDVETFNYVGTNAILPEAVNGTMTFDGWFTEATGGTRIGDAGDSYEPTADITLYAHWSNNIKVFFDAKGGNCSITSAVYDRVNAITLPTATRTGYDLVGWFTAAEGGEKVGNAGDAYAPSESGFVYAQWKIQTFTVTVRAGANGTVNITSVANVPYGTKITSSSNTVTINGTKVTATANSNYAFDNWTNGTATVTGPITVTANFKSSGGGCFAEGTLITMADGTQKAIEDITAEDEILSWNFFEGKYEGKGLAILVNHGEDTYDVLNMTFSDGTVLRTIAEHGIFDAEKNEFVYLTTENYENSIGRSFVKATADGKYETVTLVACEVTTEVTTAFSITSAANANAIAQGMLTVAPPEDFYNWISMGDTMRFDTEKFASDLAKYGTYEYNVFAGLVTEKQFENLNGKYLKIAVETGALTFERIVELIGQYGEFFI